MDKATRALQYLNEDRIMAVLRHIDEAALEPLADALVAGGVRSLAVTMDYERAPADIADSRTARFSTSVIPDGTAITMRGRTMRLRSWTFMMK